MNSLRATPSHLAPVLAGLLVAFLLGWASPASANSALDQYVEQVPDPGGNKPAKPVNPTPKPKPVVRPGSGGTGSAKTGDEPTSIVADGDSAGTDSPSGASKQHARHGKAAHTDRKSGHESNEASLRDREKPGKGAAFADVAQAAGINLPLSIFTVILAFGMVALAFARSSRSRSQ